jgi:hypothetical protein
MRRPLQKLYLLFYWRTLSCHPADVFRGSLGNPLVMLGAAVKLRLFSTEFLESSSDVLVHQVYASCHQAFSKYGFCWIQGDASTPRGRHATRQAHGKVEPAIELD